MGGQAGLAISIPDLLSGGAVPDGPPAFIMALGLVIGALGLVVALVLWHGKRWGVVATIVLRVIHSLSAAPGLVFAPTIALRLAAVWASPCPYELPTTGSEHQTLAPWWFAVPGWAWWPPALRYGNQPWCNIIAICLTRRLR